MQNSVKKTNSIQTSTLVKVSMLSAIAFILMFIAIPIPALFPDFLKIDISDLPALIGGLALGPIAGLAIEFIKNLLQFLMGFSSTGGVGEFANFIIGGSFVLVVSSIYARKKELKTLIIALIIGIVVMTITGCLANYFIILPFYGTMMPFDMIIKAGSAINSAIKDKFTFVIYIIGPFNILKATIISLFALPIYKRLENILKR